MTPDWSVLLADTALRTALDVLPIAVILFVFQALILRRRVANLRRVLVGFGYVVAGLTLFLIGLEQSLFPLGRIMAAQLTAPAFVHGAGATAFAASPLDYAWVYAFAAALGFSATVAEPALIAVADKAGEVSGGTLRPWALRTAVAFGVALGVTLGAFRIVTGTPLYAYIMAGYALVIVQTVFAPRAIIPLAYDTGGVTTSTVTVPMVTALGLGLASTIPGRSPLIDGFGIIALASLFPMITVMGYAQLAAWHARRSERPEDKEG